MKMLLREGPKYIVDFLFIFMELQVHWRAKKAQQ